MDPEQNQSHLVEPEQVRELGSEWGRDRQARAVDHLGKECCGLPSSRFRLVRLVDDAHAAVTDLADDSKGTDAGWYGNCLAFAGKDLRQSFEHRLIRCKLFEARSARFTSGKMRFQLFALIFRHIGWLSRKDRP